MAEEKRLANLQKIKARQKQYKAMGLCTCGGSPCPDIRTAPRAVRPAKRETNAIGRRDAAIVADPLCLGSRRMATPSKLARNVLSGKGSEKEGFTQATSIRMNSI